MLPPDLRNDLLHPAWFEPHSILVCVEARVQRRQQAFRFQLERDAREQRELAGSKVLDLFMEQAAQPRWVGRQFNCF